MTNWTVNLVPTGTTWFILHPEFAQGPCCVYIQVQFGLMVRRRLYRQTLSHNYWADWCAGEPSPPREYRNYQRVIEYGGFRVAYKGSITGGETRYAGESYYWNESDATNACGNAINLGNEAWVEHQDPVTGEWRKW